MCAWSRPMAANLIECVGLISGVEVFAGSTVKAPELWAKAAGAMAENMPASPALCRNSRRSLPLIVPPPVNAAAKIPRRPEVGTGHSRKEEKPGNGVIQNDPVYFSVFLGEPPDRYGAEKHGVPDQRDDGHEHRFKLELGGSRCVHCELVEMELWPDRHLP